jgi:diguanylate cyclase (GGDEF)-like protein
VTVISPAATGGTLRAVRLAGSRPAPAQRLRILALVLATVAAVLWGVVLIHGSAYSKTRALPAWGLAVLFFVTERWPVTITMRRSAPAVGLSATPLVLGLFFSPAWAIIAGYVAGATAAAALRRELRHAGTAFSIAQFSFFAAVATTAFDAVAGTVPPDDPGWVAYAAVLAATVVLVLSSVTTACAVAIHDGRMTRRMVIGSLVTTAAGVGVAASYGLLTADLLSSNPRGVLVAGVLGVVLLAGYRALLIERRERGVAEFLRGAEQALHRGGELESSIVGLISRAREMFDAQLAQLTIYPSHPGETAYRTTVRRGDPSGTEVMMPIELTDLDDILEADSDGVILHSDSTSEASRAVLQRRYIDQAMVATLRGQSRMVGSLMVGSRAGARGFDQRDLHLFQTLVIQTSSTLENGRLEQSIARLGELQEQLSHLAFHDSLTDLANRALFGDRIDHALLRRTRTGKPIAVLFIDLDDFKTVNDTLGHAAGDQLLVGVAQRLRACLRRPDTAARLGGDEFSVLIEDITHVSEAEVVADRITGALEKPFTIAGQQVVVHTSIGVAVADSDDDNAVALMRHADVAMYAAKAAGKRCRVTFVPGMEAEIVARHRLRADLERAVATGELGVHYQPIIDVRSGRLVATEALVRWWHPTRGMVAPADFIGVAEETGLILALGQQVLRKACLTTLRWQTRNPGAQPLWVSVNISARQLRQPLFVEEVLGIVHDSGLRPSSLVLELTESMVLEDAAASITKLEELKRAGVRIAIDDFGTGYSSLSYLRRLPVDILKIAKPFVDDLETHADESDFARAIIGIGSALRLTMIAEGIESVGQLRTLRGLGCHLGQGYHLSHPVAAAAIDELVDAGGVDADRLGIEPSSPSIVQFPAAR